MSARSVAVLTAIVAATHLPAAEASAAQQPPEPAPTVACGPPGPGAPVSAVPRLMQWPAYNPVWQFCFVSPAHSSGPNGSGIEIYDVFYRGHLVFKRAHAPILNVEYEPGGCGCFRDWSDSEVRFEAIARTGGTSASGGPAAYAEVVAPPRTVCEAGGGVDLGSFRGVAVEKNADPLVLTSQMLAGWYRYTMKWKFYMDGRINAFFGFSAVNHSCVSADHTHHNYWRLDFDIDGAASDSFQEGPPAGQPVPGGPLPTLTQEATFLVNPARTWIVRDLQTERGYRLLPGPSIPADPFAVSDYWMLQYGASEISDTTGQCATNLSNYINGQSVNGADVVLWVRGGQFHGGPLLDDCHSVEFTLEPVGSWR